MSFTPFRKGDFYGLTKKHLILLCHKYGRTLGSETGWIDRTIGDDGLGARLADGVDKTPVSDPNPKGSYCQGQLCVVVRPYL